ncbi:MAG: hypothetical protein KGY48_02125 [Wenzhouxiangellaceae bacterium]|nr:hypothetical protein [Wenzhouxiangellaceae bacterium]MBS3747411.1 hypothetical protein [Wenzhouxiangellaceae bacterium]
MSRIRWPLLVVLMSVVGYSPARNAETEADIRELQQHIQSTQQPLISVHAKLAEMTGENALAASIGIMQVGFGILPFASHGSWSGGMHHPGLEGDYDTGVRSIHEPGDDRTFHYAFYNNPEYANDNRSGRYSFDLVTEGDQQNSETNQDNLRAERHLSVGDLGTLGGSVSLQRDQMFGSIKRKRSERYAVAGRANANFSPWNLRLQGMRYEFDPENSAAVEADFVPTGGFDFPSLSARANVCTANGARTFGASPGPITGGTCYNDFTFIDPKVENSADSLQNVTGCSIVTGGVFACFG